MKVNFTISVTIEDLDVKGPKPKNDIITFEIQEKVDNKIFKQLSSDLKRLKYNYQDINSYITANDENYYECEVGFNINFEACDINVDKFVLSKSNICKLEEIILKEGEKKMEFFKAEYSEFSLSYDLHDWEIIV